LRLAGISKRGFHLLETLAQDLRYAARAMRRDPGFTIFALLIVGLGIGSCATVFSFLNTVLVRSLPLLEPDNLVWIANSGHDEGLSNQTTQVNPFLDLREHNQSYTDVAAYFAFYGVGDSVLNVNGETERINAVPVSQNFFPMLGVAPILGRQFSAEECKWNGPRAVLLSYGLWQRRFAGDKSIVNRTITLDNGRVTVAGVLPAAFDFGSVFAPGTHVDLYVPFALSPETNRWGNTLAIVGRLKPGVTLQRAAAETAMIGKRYSDANPRTNWFRPKVSMLRQHVSGKFRPALGLLAIAVTVVMLIVCANLSNLLLARSVSRQKELAIRSALGAGRERLIRQILTESILLSACGALLGGALAWTGTRALAQLTTFNIPLLQDVHLDVTALLFTLLLAVLTGLIFGIVPALQVPKLMLNNALKEQNRGSTDSQRHSWIRGSLVISEIAFACVLMVGTGLLVRSFLSVLDVKMGFQPERAASIRIDPSTNFDTQAKLNTYYDEALRRVRNLPGVEAAGLTDCLPLGRNRTWGVGVKGRVFTPDNYPEAFIRIVSDDYVKAMGMRVVEGRDLAASDDLKGAPVILINQTMARSLWPNESALGKIVSPDTDRKIVGVVADVRHLALEQGSGNEIYIPIRQSQDHATVDLVVRSKEDNTQLAGSVRAALLPLDPGLPNEQFVTLREIVDGAVSPRRFVVLLLSGFAGFALILASLGIYAVISYSVGQRTAEIGIRMALGASPGEVQISVLKQTVLLAGVGLVVGALVSGVMTQALRGMLFGVTPGDPITFVGMIVVLVSVALAAGYLPARRASRIDPMLALRAE
jgi:predicted permease